MKPINVLNRFLTFLRLLLDDQTSAKLCIDAVTAFCWQPYDIDAIINILIEHMRKQSLREVKSLSQSTQLVGAQHSVGGPGCESQLT